MTDARLARQSVHAAFQVDPDARLARQSVLAAFQVPGASIDARLVRQVVLVAFGDPPKKGVIHGHRTPLSLGRR